MELDEMLLGISVEAKWQQIVPTLEAAPQIYIYIYIHICMYAGSRPASWLSFPDGDHVYAK
jgi:hypothetical protein